MAHPPEQLALVTADDIRVLATAGGDSAGASFSAQKAVAYPAEELLTGPLLLEQEAGALCVKEGGGGADVAFPDLVEDWMGE